jgi:hypothetical protein
VTLICFARDDRFTIYTHSHRVQGVGADPLETNSEPVASAG